MGCRSLLTAAALLAALGFTPAQVLAQGANSGRVLAQTTGGFNPSSVQSLIDKGDAAAAAGDLTTARKAYDDARKAAKQLLAFYRDLSGAFRGLDASTITAQIWGRGYWEAAAVTGFTKLTR